MRFVVVGGFAGGGGFGRVCDVCDFFDRDLRRGEKNHHTYHS